MERIIIGMFVTSFINVFTLAFLSYLCNNCTVLYKCLETLKILKYVYFTLLLSVVDLFGDIYSL